MRHWNIAGRMHHRAAGTGQCRLLCLLLDLLLRLALIIMGRVGLILNRLIGLLLQLLGRGRQGLRPSGRACQDRKQSQDGYLFHAHKITDKPEPCSLKIEHLNFI
jgi:hypothetical protein